MIKLKDYTLKTLIDDQDCAVEAVKLEWLLKNDLNERKKQRQVDIILYLLLIMCMCPTFLYFWINRALELKENEDDEIEGECRDIKKSYGPQTDEERRRLYNLMKY